MNGGNNLKTILIKELKIEIFLSKDRKLLFLRYYMIYTLNIFSFLFVNQHFKSAINLIKLLSTI